MAVDEVEDPVPDLAWICAGVRPSGVCTVDAGDELILERGNADLEELVEVRGCDRAELGALQQRDTRLLRQLQHPVVEGQPAQFPVEKPFVDHGRGVGLVWRANAAQLSSSA
jgi:hypothetical protein